VGEALTAGVPVPVGVSSPPPQAATNRPRITVATTKRTMAYLHYCRTGVRPTATLDRITAMLCRGFRSEAPSLTTCKVAVYELVMLMNILLRLRRRNF